MSSLESKLHRAEDIYEVPGNARKIQKSSVEELREQSTRTSINDLIKSGFLKDAEDQFFGAD